MVGKLREQAGKMERVKMDMDELESELREAQQQLGEEQLAVVELVNQLREVRLMEEQEALEMGREAAIIRGHYAKILEAVQKFNLKMANDFKIIEEAQLKMSAPPAL